MFDGAFVDNDVRAFLRQLRGSTTGCVAVALVDLDANLVLTDDTEAPVGQEIWDALTLKSIDLLASDNARLLAQSLGRQTDDPFNTAKLRHGDDLFLLLRSRTEPPLGLIFICRQDTDATALIDAASEELEILAQSN